jgi:hypothetical protein
VALAKRAPERKRARRRGLTHAGPRAPPERGAIQVFGECGRHTRCAIGAYDLPRGAAVEIEALFEIGDDGRA